MLDCAALQTKVMLHTISVNKSQRNVPQDIDTAGTRKHNGQKLTSTNLGFRTETCRSDSF